MSKKINENIETNSIEQKKNIETKKYKLLKSVILKGEIKKIGEFIDIEFIPNIEDWINRGIIKK